MFEFKLKYSSYISLSSGVRGYRKPIISSATHILFSHTVFYILRPSRISHCCWYALSTSVKWKNFTTSKYNNHLWWIIIITLVVFLRYYSWLIINILVFERFGLFNSFGGEMALGCKQKPAYAPKKGIWQSFWLLEWIHKL